MSFHLLNSPKYLVNLEGNTLKFSVLHNTHPDLEEVCAFIIRKLQPFYGDTIFPFVNKIKEGKDRRCELLYLDEKAIGFIVYKTQLSNEYIDYGIENALELKTLSLFDPEIHSRKGFGSVLLQRVGEIALTMNAKMILATVSATATPILNFVLKHEFEIANIFNGKYRDGLDEYLICNKNPHHLTTLLNGS